MDMGQGTLIVRSSGWSSTFAGLAPCPHEIEVKVFGGADMFGGRGDGKAGISVGRQNITTALEIIEKEGYHGKKDPADRRFGAHSSDVPDGANEV
jgi:CheD chemotactic sensory transduction protein